MASPTPIVLPQQIMLLQSLSYLEHDLAHDLHPGQGAKDKLKSANNTYSGRMIQLRETRLDANQIQFLSFNRKIYDPSATGGGKIQIGGLTPQEAASPQVREQFAASLNPQLAITADGERYINSDSFDDTVLLSLANKFVQDKSLFISDYNRVTGPQFHGFFIIWPQNLNMVGAQGRVYISNEDPSLGGAAVADVSVYNVTVSAWPPPELTPAQAKAVSGGFTTIYITIHTSNPNLSGVFGPSLYIIKREDSRTDQQVFMWSPAVPDVHQGFLLPNPANLYTQPMIQSLQKQQGVLSSYLLDLFLGVEGEGSMQDGGKWGGRKKKIYYGGASTEETSSGMKINLAYIICMAAVSHRHAWNKVYKIRENAGMLPRNPITIAIEKESNMLSRMVKKAQDSGGRSPGATGAGDIDKHLRKFVLDMIEGATQREPGTDFIRGDRVPYTGKNTFLSDIVNKGGTNGLKYLKLFYDIRAQDKKYYLSNAVPATAYLTTSPLPSPFNEAFSVPPHFCETTSIMDGQSTCSNIQAAATGGEGAYIGDQVFTITDAGSLGGGAPPNAAITYNLYIKVEPTHSNPQSCKIYANYQCGEDILVDFGTPDQNILPNWPRASPWRQEALDVPLTGDPANSPLNAVMCFGELVATAIELYKISGQGFYDILTNLGGNLERDWAMCRQKVLNVSVRKSLGDVLQELSAAAVNGGYIFSQGKTVVPTNTIAEPNDGRLMLSNDGPSGLRSLIYVLYGRSGINPNILTGYLYPASVPSSMPGVCKPPNSCSDFFVAGRCSYDGIASVDQTQRDQFISAAAATMAGGRTYSKRHTKNSKSKKRKTKKNKNSKSKKRKSKTKKVKKKNKITRKK
jgi:hypothetical protein